MKYSGTILMGCFLVAGTAFLSMQDKKTIEQAQEESSAPIKTAPIEKKLLNTVLETYGTAVLNNASVHNISLSRSGFITHVFVTAGQHVNQGDALITISDDPEGYAAYSQAENTVEFARNERKRIENMTDKHMATDSQLAAANKALQDAQMLLAIQEKLGNGLKTQKITSELNGFVVNLSATPGDKINPGIAVIQLAADNALHVELGIEPGDAEDIHTGMKVRIVPVFDEDDSVEGTITQMQTGVNTATQLMTAYATCDPKSIAALVPGGAVHGYIILSSKQYWAVPKEAILKDDKGTYLFQIIDGKAKRVEVKASPENDGFIGIAGPFDTAKPVAITGNYELQDGMAASEEPAKNSHEETHDK